LVKDPVWKEIGVDVPSIAEVYRSIYGKDPSGPLGKRRKRSSALLVDAYHGFLAQDTSRRVTELRQGFQANGKGPCIFGEWEKSGVAAALGAGRRSRKYRRLYS